MRLIATNDPSKYGVFTAPVMVYATLSNSDNIDSTSNKGLTPLDLTRTDKPSETARLYRFDQEQVAGQHGHAAQDSREEQPVSDTAHLRPSNRESSSSATGSNMSTKPTQPHASTTAVTNHGGGTSDEQRQLNARAKTNLQTQILQNKIANDKGVRPDGTTPNQKRSANGVHMSARALSANVNTSHAAS